MAATRAYRTRKRPERALPTRDRIMAAVRELLAEGSFHDSTVEQVAERAGLSRATVYQHFRSRIDLVDAICDTFAVNPALVELRETVKLSDRDAALDRTIERAVRFWVSEDPVLAELYGVAAIDPAARDLVDRQRADRRGEMERLAVRFDTPRTLELLMILTSYESFRELRLTGLSDAQITATLQSAACKLLA